MVSVKKIMQQKLAVWMILIVVLAAAYLVVADSNEEHDNNNNNNEVISRKLMKLEPQPNCGGLGAYCDLANWCCGTLECKRNPGITDWSGTCVQGKCNGVGQPCYTPPPLMSYVCCWDLKCVDYLCQKAGSTTSEEAGIMMIGSA